MITITDKTQCCGCWACHNVCPKHCIEMVEDAEGFRYPKVDVQDCIDCDLCIKVCPIMQPMQDDTTPKNYVVQHRDKAILRDSTSGGFYSALAKWVIGQGGVVFGASFDDNMTLRHTYSENLEDCKQFRGSKYVQSLIGNSYIQAKKFLDEGRWVAFSGTPCQIAGLFGYLRNWKYDKLITVDLVCHGIPSPRLLRKYFTHHATRSGSKVVDYRSRDKHYGFQYSTATIYFEDSKKSYHKGKESDLMLGLYFKDLISRPSCYACHFKTLHRLSDFTIFDCWEARSVSKKFNRNGATNVFIHTEKGQDVFKLLKNEFVWSTSDIDPIIRRDGVMIKNSVQKNPQRSVFFKDLEYLSIEEIEKKYLSKNFAKSISSACKPFLYKIGVFSAYLKLKKFLQK